MIVVSWIIDRRRRWSGRNTQRPPVRSPHSGLPPHRQAASVRL